MNSPAVDNLSRQVLHGQKVCVTGRLAAMTHADFAALVRACGGRFQPYPIRGGFLLVIGADGWPAQCDGSPSKAFERARKLCAYGYRIEFLAEEEFFERVHLAAPATSLRARHTISDLTRILGVSAASVRRWVRMGLIRPVEAVHRYCYFSFSEVASARRLCELVAGGASLTRIRKGLEQFRTWLPAADVSFAQLSRLEQNGELLLRLNGALVEPGGQRRFDLQAEGEQTPALALPRPAAADPTRVDELFDLGLTLEDQGRFEEAAGAYRQTIALAPQDATLHFNLGNVLYALGRFEESIDSFREALACDPCYAEAWNNLGNAYAEQGDMRNAVSAFRRAVELVPDYEDALHNLSGVLQEWQSGGLRVVSSSEE